MMHRLPNGTHVILQYVAYVTDVRKWSNDGNILSFDVGMSGGHVREVTGSASQQKMLADARQHLLDEIRDWYDMQDTYNRAAMYQSLGD